MDERSLAESLVEVDERSLEVKAHLVGEAYLVGRLVTETYLVDEGSLVEMAYSSKAPYWVEMAN